MTSFGAFIKAKKAAEAHEDAKASFTPAVPVKATRPAQGIQSRIVILRKRADGTVEEKPAAPPFMRQDHKALVEKINLPPDYYWRGSPEHLAKKAELEGAE